MNIPLPAESLFHIGSFPVTNAYVNSTILTLAIVVFGFVIHSSIKKGVPGKLQNAVEALMETLLGYFDQVTGSRARSLKFLPFIGSLFVFIMLSNWMGLLPGTGSIGVWQTVHGEQELVPLLRPANSDLNLTLAMALLSVVGSHLVGMITVGFFVHWNRFIQIGTLWNALKTLNPLKIAVAFVEFIVGFIEIVSEVAKVLSLSLRLFGNIFAGEVLITVISSLMAYFVPLPFMFLELLVGLIQASVFAMLSLVYLTVLTEKPHHEKKHDVIAEELEGKTLIGEPSSHPQSAA